MTSEANSLFRLLDDQFADRLSPLQCGKPTLRHLSHTLEDLILSRRLPAVICTGFQNVVHWRVEAQRYRALAKIARQVSVFADAGLVSETDPNILYIPLAEKDPLLWEWFVLILSEEFSAVLCGEPILPSSDQPKHAFNVLWSFEPEIVNHALDWIEEAMQRYAADGWTRLRQARATYTRFSIDLGIITHFTTEMLRSEQELQHSLIQARREQQRIHEQLERDKAVLHQSEMRYRVLSELISDYAFAYRVNPDGTLENEWTTESFTQVTGYQLGEIDMSHNLFYPEDQARAARDIAETVSGTPTSGEYRIVTKNGDVRWVHINRRPIWDEAEQRVVRVYGGVQDVTIRKQAEAARLEQEGLRVALEKERELSRLKTDFMTTVSHEFRTPLAIILSASELLEHYYDRLAPEERTRRFKMIETHINRISEMLADIQIILEGGRQLGFSPMPLNVDNFCQMVIDSLDAASDEPMQIRLTTSGQLRNLLLDPQLLKYILKHLLSNAIKYSPDNTPVELAVSASADHIEFQVRDQGIGIPESDRAHLFEPFARGSNVGAVGGTGLGLKIVRDCVQLHGGEISYESALGKGTTFTVSLPISGN